MPHFVIECSQAVLEDKSPEEIMRAVYQVADATGLFAANDIKVRLQPYRHFLLGHGKKDFVHVFGSVMEGRTTEDKADLSRRVVERLCEMLPEVSFISISMGEFERATYANKALVHPLNTTGDRHFDAGE